MIADGQKHRPQMSAAGRGDHAHGEEQCAFDQDVVRGIESRCQCGAAISGDHSHANDRDDESHLAHARIRQHDLGIAFA